MIMFDINNTCTDPTMVYFSSMLKKILNIIHIVGPILCIVSLVFIFIKLVINPEEKKLLVKLKNAAISLIVLFMLPYIVDVAMYAMGSSVSLSDCWNNSEEVFLNSKGSYIESENVNRVKIVDGIDKKSNPNPNSASSFNGMGPAQSIKIRYNVEDSKGRCGRGRRDKCMEVAEVNYGGTVITYYMGYQNNSGLLGGSCRAHAFTCGMNAVNNTNYSTLDLQNYMETINGDGVFKGKYKYESAISYFNVPAKAYFEETSIQKSYYLAKEALDNGNPVIIFVSSQKCSDLASSHHALLLLGYDSNGDVVFLDSCGRYPNAKKRNLEELILGCMSGDRIARNWMRMVIFSFN